MTRAGAGWASARLAETPKAGRRIPLRQHFGIRAFGVNAFAVAEARARVIPEHDETPRGHEELYVVVEGAARFVIAGEDVEAPAGTVVFISDPSLVRTAFAQEANTTVLVVGAAPGEMFQPSPWELWSAEARPLYDAGNLTGAIAVSERLLAEHPDEPNLLFNLACCESRAGRRDDAIAHLRRALELRPMWGYRVREERDLDAIRDDPLFPA